MLDQATWGVNSLAHRFGTRLHATRDNSRNLGLLALFSVGGSWHNNHHACPALARTDHRFWQIDLVATAIAGMAVIAVIIGAFLVELGRGHDGNPYAALGAIGGVTYLIAIVVLRLRR